MRSPDLRAQENMSMMHPEEGCVNLLKSIYSITSSMEESSFVLRNQSVLTFHKHYFRSDVLCVSRSSGAVSVCGPAHIWP